MAAPENTIVIEDARLIFRNFEGREGPYNREGDRNFCVLLDGQLADALVSDGWNVKHLAAREEGDEPQPYLQVSVGNKGRPAKIVMITSRGRTDLSQDEIVLLDWADIKVADIIIRPYNWEVGGRGGVKAYLKSIFVTINEDALELKYADVEEVPSRSGRVEE